MVVADYILARGSNDTGANGGQADGTGDRDNPTPGDAGLLFIDDIGVGKP